MKEKDKNKMGHFEFLRYFNGEMTDGERNAFERKLQKDMFEEEASEGLSELRSDQIATDLSSLERRLKSRVSRRNTIVFYRIAASVAVLLVLSSVFIVLTRKGPSEQSVKIPDKAVTFDISESEALIEPSVPAEQPEKITAAENVETRRVETAAPAIITEVVLAENKVKTDIPEKSDRLEKNIVTKAEPELSEILAARQKAAMPAAGAGAVTGVTFKRTREAMDLNEKEISTDSLISALEEVVVVGYGVSQKTENEFTGYSPPVPSGGKSGFENYIKENIRKPAILAEGERAVVVIGVLIKSTGIIDSLKVIRSPGKEFSEEAIRLIREGPSWLPAENNGAKIDDETRIRIIFK